MNALWALESTYLRPSSSLEDSPRQTPQLRTEGPRNLIHSPLRIVPDRSQCGGRSRACLDVKECQAGQAGDLMNALWALESTYLRASSSLEDYLANYDEKLDRTARPYHSVFHETERLRPSSVHASRLAVGTPPEMNELKNRAHTTSARPCESPHREAPLTHPHSLPHSTRASRLQESHSNRA
ncbi:hypothetical protein HETIRDRAFT_447417 [Heterobasidion irregulare TC 32-1]|uniref:Uncharacterized protein n=1 Tax=Heterobasidion irregulare (strain TC 32-1) TaxID=747525 RepID=W4KLL0_HETIT|nr:uncharacterized protein HETIRDRAFT_447417 [Heterobasidion irregulare TC 32-1]ETW86738.1 hypothetical protein HETIRDRAFT_447417 [Heterobasidion irregulare TC 32-1]